MDPVAFKARVEQIFADLDRYSYYELLNLPSSSGTEDIRKAFHRMALTMHPDRHFTVEDQDLRAQLYQIYKRISEGYRVLMNAEQRQAYDARLAEGQLRLVTQERQRRGPEAPEDSVENPLAKKFFVLGLKAERAGDMKTARLNYKFALDMAPGHPTITERMERVDKWMGAKR